MIQYSAVLMNYVHRLFDKYVAFSIRKFLTSRSTYIVIKMGRTFLIALVELLTVLTDLSAVFWIRTVLMALRILFRNMDPDPATF